MITMSLDQNKYFVNKIKLQRANLGKTILKDITVSFKYIMYNDSLKKSSNKHSKTKTNQYLA